MILPDFILTASQNQILIESGIDSRQLCLDQKHFDSYPYTIEYRYNSRGFRDDEWPTSVEELKKCIWCFGDSFTVGLGSPLSHTWVNILQNKLLVRCINVSMDGASNDWIARKVVKVLEEIQPQHIIVHWSYLTRGELNDSQFNDEKRRRGRKNIFLKDQFNNLKKNLILVEQYNKKFNIIHSFIPKSSELCEINVDQLWNQIKGANWPNSPKTTTEFNQLNTAVINEIHSFNVYEKIEYGLLFKDLTVELTDRYIPIFDNVDLARDGHHYDYLTAGKFVDSIIERLKISSS